LLWLIVLLPWAGAISACLVILELTR
jgi:hypothetical protein